MITLKWLLDMQSTPTGGLAHRVSVLVQRYNAVLLLDTLPATDCTH